MPLSTHICEQCGREFQSGLSTARYCSDKCRSTANRKLREAREQEDPLTRLNAPEVIEEIRRTIWWGLRIGGILNNTVLNLELKSSRRSNHQGLCPVCQGSTWYEAAPEGDETYLQCADCRTTTAVSVIESGVRLTWEDYLRSYNLRGEKQPAFTDAQVAEAVRLVERLRELLVDDSLARRRKER